MDLKHSGITWVGNFFQKLEAVCQEVDDIVSKDTVKYVENQFQNMGGSVKRFCADVVQDVLPPLVDPVKHEAKAVDAAISTCLKSMIGYEENHVDAVIKQSRVEPITVDHAKNQLPDASSGLHLEDHNNSTSEDSLEEAEADSSLQKVDGVLTNENANMCTEEDAIEYSTNEVLKLTSSGDRKTFEASLHGGFNDDNHENAIGVLSEVSPASSFHCGEFQSPEKMGTVCDSLAEVTESVSDLSSISSFSRSEFSVVSGEKTMAEMGLVFSSSSLSVESCGLSQKSPENSRNAVSCNSAGNRTCCSFSELTSSTLAPTNLSERKALELGLASSCSILSSESLGWDLSSEEYTSRVEEMLSLAESSGNRHINFSESAQGHSQNLDNDINDPGLETIELCDKAKLDEGCVIVEPSELYAVSHRTRKLRSYRRKIQDAFTSKKRLAEEYEQLAIWYGDADMWSSEETLQSTSEIPLDLKNLHIQPACDSDWELL